MEPIHVYALLRTRVDEEMLRKEVEQHFAVGAMRRHERRSRAGSVRHLLIRRRTPTPAPQPAI